MAVNLDKPQRWKADTQLSVDDYNRWFLEYAPITYRETRARATVYVEDILLRTDNLRRLTADLLFQHPDSLEMLRMSTSPPIARERLVGLAQVSKSLIENMERNKRISPNLPETVVREQLERMVDSFRDKVGDDENDRLLLHALRQIIEGSRQVGSGPVRLEGEQIANHPEDMAPPLPGRQYVLDPVGEENQSYAIVVSDGGHRQHRGQLRGELTLEPAHRSKSFGSGKIDCQHHRELTLFDVALDEWPAHARRDVPVDGAYVVAGLVFPHLREFHSLPLEDRAILSGKQRIHESAGAELDEFYLAKYLWRYTARRFFAGPSGSALDHGAGIASRTRLTIWSLDTSSASAS